MQNAFPKLQISDFRHIGMLLVFQLYLLCLGYYEQWNQMLLPETDSIQIK